MLDHHRGALAHRTTSDRTLVPASVRAGLVAVLAAIGLALSAAGPAGANPNQRSVATPVPVSTEALQTQLDAFFRRPCGSSPHGTRRTIVDPFSGRESVVRCNNGTWEPVD